MNWSGKTAIIVLFGLLPNQPIYAESFTQSQSEFQRFKAQTDSEFESDKKEFKLYKQQLQAAFDQYKRQTAQIWGNKEAVLPNHKNWISYQGDLSHRSIVDYEQGTIDVEIAVPADKKPTDAEVRKQLKDTILKTLTQGSDNRSLLEISRKPVAVSTGAPVLKGQIADNKGQDLKQNDFSNFADQTAASSTQHTIKGTDGKSRIVYRTQLKLVPDHIKRRASQFQQDVNEHAAKYQISAAVIFAVMETESYFNPMAKSPAPAFGLMQLVPTSGAREAYRFVYKQDKVVTDTYLYNPTNNIELGSAYLHRLNYYYMSDITNPTSRQWAAIAAYNTGPGNVFRAFAGKYSRSKHGSYDKWKQSALNEINRMSPDQVYQHLRNQLPYKETREYVKKIRERIGKYQSS